MSSTITEQPATTMEEPLARMVAFEPTTFPVLSVDLNTQPDQHGRAPDAAPYLHREFKALSRTWAPSFPERHSLDQDVERIVRRVGNAHQEHAKEVTERLAQIVREDQVSHIILAGDSVVIPLLQEQLPPEMVPMLEVMKLDIHASEHDILIATSEQLQEQEVKTAAEKVDRLMHQYRARGLAFVGLHETLEALANGQVEQLLISGMLDGNHPLPEEVEAIFAPERSPIRREERKATNRGKRPCPICWLPKPSKPAQP